MRLAAIANAAAPTELARTGLDSGALGILGLLLVTLGCLARLALRVERGATCPTGYPESPAGRAPSTGARRVGWALAALTSLALGVAPASADRAFDVRFSQIARGDILLRGNTLMTCPDSAGSCASARAGTAAGANNNNDYGMVRVDVDADPATFSSSRADLNVPAGSTILFAGLYWTANAGAGAGGDGPPDAGALGTVLFDSPAAGGYATVAAAQLDTFSGGGNYQGFANVTAAVSAAGNGTYTVADVQSGTGQDRQAGWALVVAYRNPALAPRSLTVFDGFVGIDPNDPPVNIPVSGFLTPPSGPVATDIGLVVSEGDLGFTGDSLALDGAPLSNAGNPGNNFANSSINEDGVSLTAKSPDYANQLGFDVDRLNANGLLANGQTSAVLTLSTSSDRWIPGVATFATDIAAPDLELTKSVTDVNGGLVRPGDVLEYTVLAANEGQDAATNVAVRDAIPANTTYVGGSLQISSGANAGPKTDAALDDQAEFEAGADRVDFRLGSGATATAGGRLAPGASSSFRFRVRVAQNTPSGADIDNQATATYVGETLGNPFDAESNTVTNSVAPAAAPPPPADLVVDKSVLSGNPRVGEELVYMISVTNDGPGTATGVVLTDSLPEGVRLVRATPSQGSCTGTRTLRCELGTLARGARATVRVTVVPTRAGTIVNTASAAGAQPDPDPADNTSRTSSRIAIARTRLSLEKRPGVRTVRPGQVFAYTLVLRNRGATTARSVRVCDRLPRQLTFVSARRGTLRGGRVCFRRVTVAPGRRVRFRLRVRVDLDARGTIRNVAVARGANARTTTDLSRVRVRRRPPSGGGGGVTG